jgi:hypothetical protein
MSEEEFAAWRVHKKRQLIGATTPEASQGRRRYANSVLRKYIKKRRARIAMPEA